MSERTRKIAFAPLLHLSHCIMHLHLFVGRLQKSRVEFVALNRAPENRARDRTNANRPSTLLRIMSLSNYEHE
jgi:hypothetical protein